MKNIQLGFTILPRRPEEYITRIVISEEDGAITDYRRKEVTMMLAAAGLGQPVMNGGKPHELTTYPPLSEERLESLQGTLARISGFQIVAA